jgi:hypothetical protein
MKDMYFIVHLNEIMQIPKQMKLAIGCTLILN